MPNTHPNKRRENEIRNFIITKINEFNKTKKHSNVKKLLLNRLLLETFNTNDLSGINLSKIDFSGCSLDYLNLSSCNLSHCIFSNSSLSNTDLNNSKLDNADFTNAYLVSTILTNTNLFNIKFKYALIHFTNFSGSKLSNIDFSKSDVTQPNFSNARLCNVNLHNLELSNSNFACCDIRKCNLNKSILRHANFFEAQLNNVSFEYSDLSESCFIRSRIMSVSFYEAVLTNVNLSFSMLSYKIRKSFYEHLTEFFTDNGTSTSVFTNYYGHHHARSNSNDEEWQIILQFRKELENMYQLHRSRDLSQANIYRVDGLPINDNENTLLKNGCKKTPITDQEIAKLKNIGEFNLSETNKFCLFKAINQAKDTPLTETKKLNDSEYDSYKLKSPNKS